MGNAYDAIIVGARFRDGELCAAALHQSLGGARPFDEAMAEYQSTRAAMDAFVRMNAGTISLPEFLAPEHVGPIMAAAAQRSGGAERRAS
jgi:hypothetical protein